MTKEGVRDSTFGFAVSFAAMAALSWLLYCASDFIGSLHPPEDQALIASAHRDWVRGSALIMAISLFSYWMICGIVGQPSMLKKTASNWLLIASIFIFSLSVLQTLPVFFEFIIRHARYDCTPPCPPNSDGQQTYCLRQTMLCPNSLGWIINFITFWKSNYSTLRQPHHSHSEI